MTHHDDSDDAAHDAASRSAGTAHSDGRGDAHDAVHGRDADAALEQELRTAFHAAAQQVEPAGRTLPDAASPARAPRRTGWFARHRAVVAAAVAVLAVAGGIWGGAALIRDDGAQVAGSASSESTPGGTSAGSAGAVEGSLSQAPPLNPDGVSGSSSASCVAPFVNASKAEMPSNDVIPQVRAGEAITLYGHFYGGCNDTLACTVAPDGSQTCHAPGGSGSARQVDPVTLTVSWPDDTSTELGPIMPDSSERPSFTAELEIPADTPPGTVTIDDGLFSTFTVTVLPADGPGLGPTLGPGSGSVSGPVSTAGQTGPVPTGSAPPGSVSSHQVSDSAR